MSISDLSFAESHKVTDSGLFYGGPSVILTVLFISAIVIAFIVWKKRCKFFHLLCHYEKLAENKPMCDEL